MGSRHVKLESRNDAAQIRAAEGKQSNASCTSSSMASFVPGTAGRRSKAASRRWRSLSLKQASPINRRQRRTRSTSVIRRQRSVAAGRQRTKPRVEPPPATVGEIADEARRLRGRLGQNLLWGRGRNHFRPWRNNDIRARLRQVGALLGLRLLRRSRRPNHIGFRDGYRLIGTRRGRHDGVPFSRRDRVGSKQ